MKEIIDLTYNIEEGMLTFNAPWHPHVSIKQLGRIGLEGRETREITFGTHTGTHMDAPLHFIKNGGSIEKIELSNLIGDVSIVDFSTVTYENPVTKEMLEQIKISERMIFKFGWGIHWGDSQFYADWPYFTKEAARYLVDNGMKVMGLDTPSPDDCKNKLGTDEDSPIHKILLGQNIVLVEYLANLDLVDASFTDWNLIALPMNLKGADGAPARVCIYRERK